VFDLDRLLPDTRAIGDPLPQAPETVEAWLSAITRRRALRFRPPGVRELRLSRDAVTLRLLRLEGQRILDREGENGLRAVRAVLLEPPRSIGGRRRGTIRRHRLIGVVEDDLARPWRMVVVRLDATSDKPSRLVGIESALLPVSEPAPLRRQLAVAYLDAEEPDSLIERRPGRPKPTVVWLRAPADEAARAGLVDAIAAQAATYGFRTVAYLDTDARVRQIAANVKQLQPDLVCVWDHDQRGGSMAAALGASPGGAEVVVVSGNRTTAIEEAQTWLAVRAEQPRHVEDRAAASVPEALDRAARRVRHVTIHPQAHARAAASRFRRPHLVEEMIAVIDEIAGRYRSGDLAEGFVAAFRDQRFSYADDVSSTAKQRYSEDYRLVLDDGRPMMMGPHLKVGDDNAETGLRIYWCVDREHSRLIVGHVGRHLRDARSNR